MELRALTKKEKTRTNCHRYTEARVEGDVRESQSVRKAHAPFHLSSNLSPRVDQDSNKKGTIISAVSLGLMKHQSSGLPPTD